MSGVAGTASGIGRAPLVLAIVVLGLAVFGFALPRHHGVLFPSAAPDAPVAATRTLQLIEGADATLTVRDARTGAVVAVLGEKQDGFVHGVAHGLQVTRRHDGIAADAPFTLTLYRDRRLVLRDPSDGERIEIEGFGPTNAASWLRFLPGGGR